METLEQIKEMTELLSVDTTKFFKGNKSAGTRARKTAQDLKALLQKLRGEILYICFCNISYIKKCRKVYKCPVTERTKTIGL
jgi:hypothetical protein